MVDDIVAGAPVPAGKAGVLARVCEELTAGDRSAGEQILRAEYPFAPAGKANRRYTERECLRVFYRDGFLDRYSGTQLVNPGALRLLSVLLPDAFPADPHWNMERSHIGFWELFPTIDHIVPIARGGVDDSANWVTTSMLRNSAKAHWTLDELNWQMVPAGTAGEWDGLSGWLIEYAAAHPDQIAGNKYVGRWLSATTAVAREQALIDPVS
ncbi:HNH endonuclease [Gordonia zhaorongruii]|uniref:HNH endonuclease n=1 Tax=Gordonia zhaorongruii TaxID=2597659 RepID=UPI00104CD15E|nr:HNH endonuclease signature motif containing protein [Gordonia zhaorongruii]